MTSLRRFVLPVCGSLILFSCNERKSSSTTISEKVLPVETKSATNVSTSTDLQLHSEAYLKNITQTFIVQSKKTTIVKGKKGLTLTVNPAALETTTGQKINGDIVVSLIELTTSNELFKSNATTVSNGKLLASGGSYFIGMTANGSSLKLKAGEHLQAAFPKIKDNDMELFYGNRTASGAMNWTAAKQSFEAPFTFYQNQNYTLYAPPFPDTDSIFRRFYAKYDLYDSVNCAIFFQNKKTTVAAMVEDLQKRGINKRIDSVYVGRDFIKSERFSLEKIGNMNKKYRIVSDKDLVAEKDSLAKFEKIKATQKAANDKYYAAWQQANNVQSVTGKLQNYYAPSTIGQLGWINCDRFYDRPTQSELPLDIPITFNNTPVNYFIIYKSFNGVINGTAYKNKSEQYMLSALPEGEPVTLVVFAKNNGQLFHAKQDFVIRSGKAVKLNFKVISKEAIKEIFGANVRT